MANEYFWGQKKDGTWGLGGDTTEFQPGAITGVAGNYGQSGEQQAFGQMGTGQTGAGLGDSLFLGQSPEYWQKFGAEGGMVGDQSVAGQALAGQTDTSKDFMGMNPDQWGSAMKAGQIGLGAGQLGLGIASYFENKGLADKQKKLYGQQIESNQAELDSRKNYRDALSKF